MGLAKSPTLPLTSNEKASLRKAKKKMRDIHQLEVMELAEMLSVPY
ncbi:hypothetical protein [Salipaludibacillus daqingensis]